MAGNNVQVGSSGANANNGSVTYRGALSGTIGSAGTVTQAQPPFVFGQVFTELRSNSAAYGRLAATAQCAGSGARWVEPYIPGNAAAPLHPNQRGMQAMAAMVVAAR